MLYGITQCYLPPSRGDIPAFTPAEAGTREESSEDGLTLTTYVGVDGSLHHHHHHHHHQWSEVLLASSPTGPEHGPSGGLIVVVPLFCTLFIRPAGPVAPCCPLSPVAPATIDRHVRSVMSN